MDPFDQSLLSAWDRVRREKSRAEMAKGIQRHAETKLAAALRSWSLVIRAGDARLTGGTRKRARLDELCNRLGRRPPVMAVAYHLMDLDVPGRVMVDKLAPAGGDAGEYVRLDAVSVRGLCSLLQLPFPGMSPAEAALLLGVAVPTIWRWAGGRASVAAKRKVEPIAESEHFAGRLPGWIQSEGPILHKRVYINSADRKRDKVVVWQRYPWGVDPCGEVYARPQWGRLRRDLVDIVPDDFEQIVLRMRLVDTLGRVAWMWRCAGEQFRGCLGWVTRLYWVMPVWTVSASQTRQANGLWRSPTGEGFVCRACAGLVYESSERHWGRRHAQGKAVDDAVRERRSREIAWDRFIRRVSHGLVRGHEVRDE